MVPKNVNHKKEESYHEQQYETLWRTYKPAFTTSLADGSFECGNACPKRGTQLTASSPILRSLGVVLPEPVARAMLNRRISRERKARRSAHHTPMQTIPFPVSATAFPLYHGVRELLENALDQALLIANSRGEVILPRERHEQSCQSSLQKARMILLPNEIRIWLIKGGTSKPLVIRHPKKGEIEIRNFILSPSGNLSLMRIEHRLVQKVQKRYWPLDSQHAKRRCFTG